METVTLFDGTDILAPMTESEARTRVEAIKAGIFNIGRQLLELYERDGWRALGYDSWRACAQVEFGFKQSHVYRLLEAAEIERNISPNGESEPIPESHLRPLASLPAEIQPLVYEQAVATAPNGKVTAAHVQAVVDEYKRPLPLAAANHAVSDDPDYDGDEWYTPATYIEAARRVMGAIDLDPATCAAAQELVKADAWYTKQDDSLTVPWAGRVWLNPPYSMPLIRQFVSKLIGEHEKGNVTEAVILTNNSSDTAWFHDLLSRYPACFTRGRVQFWRPTGDNFGARQGQVLFYLGDNIEVFKEIFESFGQVVGRL